MLPSPPSASPPRRSRWREPFLLAVAVASLSSGGPTAGTPEIEILNVKPISADEPRARHFESWLAVNPLDSGNLVAASIVFTESGGGIAVYASRDGGAKWTRSASAAGGTIFPGIDPAIAFDRRGNAYFATLSGGVSVWRSSDGGRRWEGPVRVPGSDAADRPFVACTERGGATEVHVVSKGPITILGQRAAPWGRDFDVLQLSTSHDLGAAFDFPRLLLPDHPGDVLNAPSSMIATPGGGLVVGLQTFPPQDLLAAPLTARYSTISSGDRGASFSDPSPIATWHTFGHAAEGRSLFGLGFAGLAMDDSRPGSSGALHAVWLDLVDGFYRVMSARSADGGRRWSPPIRVEDAAPRADSSNPAIAVDGNGVVGVVWNDRRNDLTERCYQTYFAASLDGGATFSKNIPVDPRFTCPIGAAGTPGSDADPVTSEFRYKNGGETQGIVGLPSGGFDLAWIGGAAPGEKGIPLSAATVRIPAPK